VQPVVDDVRYQLVPESGVVATREEAGAFDGAALRTLQKALDGASTAGLQAACVPLIGPLRASLRALLHYHLGTPALRTRQVMQGVQRLLDTAAHRTPEGPHEPARRP